MDADFALIDSCTAEALDAAKATVGFRRNRDRYVHDELEYFVEFPRGPLGIGGDSRIRPVWKTRRGARALALSATDSCRDRLAAFYHWNDRQALSAAVSIALRHRLNFALIRRWSEAEDMLNRYEVFRTELARSRKADRKRARG